MMTNYNSHSTITTTIFDLFCRQFLGTIAESASTCGGKGFGGTPSLQRACLLLNYFGPCSELGLLQSGYGTGTA